MELITRYISHQLYVAIGARTASSRMLEMAAHLSLRGRILILDCGNRANPYPLARKLRGLTKDPVQALENIDNARAFTCYQVVALLEETAHSGPPFPPVLVFDLLSTFYDESVSFNESQRLLNQSLLFIDRISRSVPVAVSARPPAADFPQRRVFLHQLCQFAGEIWEEPLLETAAPQQLSLFP
jgi:hypothetical protein